MSYTEPLQVVLDRTGYADPAKGAFFFWDEVRLWPSGSLDTLVSSGLLQPAQPQTTIECDGCEEKCINKPVVVYPAQEGKPGRAFIDCIERDDIGRIRINFDRLRQWRCTAEAVCDFVAASLGLRRSDKRCPASADFLEIGMATGDKRSQMLCLQTGGELMLVSGGNRVPLADLVAYRDGDYLLDSARVGLLVDAATTADNRYTPSNAKREARKVDTQAMYKEWQKAYREFVKKRPNMPETWYATQIAKLPVAKGRDSGTIKKKMHA